MAEREDRLEEFLAHAKAFWGNPLLEWAAEEIQIRRNQIEEARKTRWKCESCGCEFPHIAFDDDVERCTQCVTVDVQGQMIERLRASNAALRKALGTIIEVEPDEKPDGTILGYLVHEAEEMSAIARAALAADKEADGDS